MSDSLDALPVLVADCQTSGATPVHGDLLELGWGVVLGSAGDVVVEAEWIRPATARLVSRPVRALTGWDPSVVETSIDPLHAWARLQAAAQGAQPPMRDEPMPTVIHFARFELAFLRHLHATSEQASEPFPLDVVCLHTIASRLFPDLPRLNLRALAGHLGGSPQIVRRAKGHVEATAVVWRAVIPLLAQAGVHTWSELKSWLDTKATNPRSRASARVFPLPSARRRSLPDAPGVYRFLRPNGDVLYVGKAASLKRRVASHFTTGARATDRALEMLSQAHDIDATATATALEAALLEADEIKRLDPPYNIQLRGADRFAWFSTRDFSHTTPAIDDTHRVGPLPSRGAVSGISAIHALLLGDAPSDRLRAHAVGVPPAFAPDADLFEPVWQELKRAELSGPGSARKKLLDASKRIVVSEKLVEEGAEAEAPVGWDAATIRRYLERVIVAEGLLVRRARLLALLSDAHVVFREPGHSVARLLVLRDGVIRERLVVDPTTPLPTPEPPPPRHVRLGAFDASRYDRLRVLTTELQRIARDGGSVEVRIGRHTV